MVAPRTGLGKKVLQPANNQPSNGGISTFDIPTGPEYHDIFLEITDAVDGRSLAEMLTDISHVVWKKGSRDVLRLTIAQLTMLIQFYQGAIISPSSNGMLPIFFSRPWMTDIDVFGGIFDSVDGPAFGTHKQSSVTLEVHWAASGVAATAIKAHAFTSPKGAQLGTYTTIKKFQVKHTGTGEQSITEIPKNEGDIVAIHVPLATITDIRFLVDDVPRIDTTRNVLHQELLRPGRTVQSGWTHIDFAARNRFSDIQVVENAETVELLLEHTADPGGSYDLIIERVQHEPHIPD